MYFGYRKCNFKSIFILATLFQMMLKCNFSPLSTFDENVKDFKKVYL